MSISEWQNQREWEGMLNKRKPCPICDGKLNHAFDKAGFEYFECKDCLSIVSFDITKIASPLGGDNEEERNISGNEGRIARIKLLNNENGPVLDFGCGHGFLVDDMRKEGIEAFGYDPNSDDCRNRIFPCDKFAVVTMIEVIEHLTSPFKELDMINNVLIPGGFLFIESSFRWDDMTVKDVQEWDYCNPMIGHSTILSITGLKTLLKAHGFGFVGSPDNRNTWVFSKED